MTLFFVLAGCTGQAVGTDPNVQGDDSGFEDGEDQLPPTIEFEPLTDNQPSGEDVAIVATIVDDQSGVFIASLYFRNETASSKDWKSVGFVPDGGGGVYTATISADEQRSGGMWYYLLARDGAQNESVSPAQGSDQPYHFGYSD